MLIHTIILLFFLDFLKSAPTEPITKDFPSFPSGKRYKNVPGSVGDDDYGESFEVVFLYDQMLSGEYYEAKSDALVKTFKAMHRQRYFHDLIVNGHSDKKIKVPKFPHDYRYNSTKKVKSVKSKLTIDEPVKPFPSKMIRTDSSQNSRFRPVQIVPKMVSVNLYHHAFLDRKQPENLLILLTSFGPDSIASIIKFLQSKPDLLGYFIASESPETKSEMLGNFLFLARYYWEQGELLLFRVFLENVKFPETNNASSKIYDLIVKCINDVTLIEIIFETQSHLLRHNEYSIFDLLLDQPNYQELIQIYFDRVTSESKSANLLSKIFHYKDTSRDDLLNKITDLNVNQDIRMAVKSGADLRLTVIAPLILGCLYIKSRQNLLEILLENPQIDLNQNYKFIEPFDHENWPMIPLHLHAFILKEFKAAWQICFHPQYKNFGIFNIWHMIIIIFKLFKRQKL